MCFMTTTWPYNVCFFPSETQSLLAVNGSFNPPPPPKKKESQAHELLVQN